MAWKLSGTLYRSGMPGVLEWDGQQLKGDTASVAAVRAYVVEHGQLPVTPTGPFLQPDLADETCALVAAYLVLGSDGTLMGDPPAIPLPAVPVGAIP